jgi:DNA-binding CsgD family transcriptional regulator
MRHKSRGAPKDPLTADERSRAGALAESLQPLALDAPPALETFLPELRRILGAQLAVAFGAGTRDAAFQSTFGLKAGLDSSGADLLVDVDEWMHRSPKRWALYDPSAPEPRQRNAVVNVGRYLDLVAKEAEGKDLRALGVNRQAVALARERLTRAERLRGTSWLFRQHQLRSLICDGSQLLAWVGAVDCAPFGPREEALLRAVVPALQRRLSLERRLGDALLFASGLVAALEAVAAPAFLIDATGRVRHANPEGQAWLEQQGAQALERLQRAGKGLPSGFRVTPLHTAGVPPHALAIWERPDEGDARRLEAFATRLTCTPRERQVLALLIRGEANKTIAAELQCSAKTVELHLTHLFRKARVTSRAQLAAAFWAS